MTLLFRKRPDAGAQFSCIGQRASGRQNADALTAAAPFAAWSARRMRRASPIRAGWTATKRCSRSRPAARRRRCPTGGDHDSGVEILCRRAPRPPAPPTAARATEIAKALAKPSGWPTSDIQTAQSLAQPDRLRPPQGPVSGQQYPRRVRLRDVPKAGEAVAAATAAGANVLSGPSLQIDDPEKANRGAYIAAYKAARTRAEAYAEAAGMEIARVLTIRDGGHGWRRYPYADGAMPWKPSADARRSRRSCRAAAVDPPRARTPHPRQRAGGLRAGARNKARGMTTLTVAALQLALGSPDEAREHRRRRRAGRAGGGRGRAGGAAARTVFRPLFLQGRGRGAVRAGPADWRSTPRSSRCRRWRSSSRSRSRPASSSATGTTITTPWR